MTTPDAPAAVACNVCVTRKVSPATWRYVGESCSHVECPHRRPLTAAPSSSGRGFDESPKALLSEFDPWD